VGGALPEVLVHRGLRLGKDELQLLLRVVGLAGLEQLPGSIPAPGSHQGGADGGEFGYGELGHRSASLSAGRGSVIADYFDVECFDN
jgi:hypothetical protein